MTQLAFRDDFFAFSLVHRRAPVAREPRSAERLTRPHVPPKCLSHHADSSLRTSRFPSLGHGGSVDAS